jgi:hypothetical protein
MPRLAEQTNAGAVRSKSAIVVTLAAILLVVGALRMSGLTHTPPGLNQDEADNAWDAYCLLKHGTDQHGVSWPLFCTRGFGDNRSAIFLYTMLPFQAVGGLNVWTTRLPAAALGVLTVLLLYYTGARLWGANAGLVAAALLALSPWHIQLSRTGNEAGATPFLALLPLAAWLWARLPAADEARPPVPWRALVGGLLAGLACYGYAPVRLVTPVTLVLVVLLTARRWRGLLRSRLGIKAAIAATVGFAATFGPLAYQHVVHPERIARRAEGNWLWEASDSFSARAGKVVQRYAGHFGPDFLFLAGDHHETQFVPGFGAFSWYVLPLMGLGLVCVAARFRQGTAAGVLLCWLLVSPLGDSLHRGFVYEAAGGRLQESMHALRSAPMVCPALLLAGLGAAAGHQWLWSRRRRLAVAGWAALGLAVVLLDARFLLNYFTEYPRRQLVYESYQADLVEACMWIRPRMGAADGVFFSAQDMNAPYVVSLVVLAYEPAQWFRDVRGTRTLDGWDICTQTGKLHFLFDAADRAVLGELERNGRPEHVILVLRPGEMRGRQPAYIVDAPDGTPYFEVYDTEL